MLAIEQLLGCLESRAVREVALLDVCRIERQTRLFDRRLEAGESLRAGGLVRMALDEADARMSERDEMRGHIAARAEIIDAHAADVGAKAPGRDRDHGNVR